MEEAKSNQPEPPETRDPGQAHDGGGEVVPALNPSRPPSTRENNVGEPHLV